MMPVEVDDGDDCLIVVDVMILYQSDSYMMVIDYLDLLIVMVTIVMFISCLMISYSAGRWLTTVR